MRHILCGALVLIAAGHSAFAADNPANLSVEITANRDIKFATLSATLSALRKNLDDQAQVVIGVQEAKGMAAKVHVSTDTPYRQLSDLLGAVRRSGIESITVVATHPK